MNTSSIPYQPFDAVFSESVAKTTDWTLYHGNRWVEALRRTYGFDFQLIQLTNGTKRPLAACAFARSKNMLHRRFISLPFSDSCPPLALESKLLPIFAENLLRAQPERAEFEIRGYAAGSPWEVVDTFIEWKLRLDDGLPAIERAMDRNFRRQIRRGEQAGLVVRHGNGSDDIRAFYKLMLMTRSRLGLPVQPLRFFRELADLYANDLQIWLASQNGNDVAAAFLLRENNRLYFKWSARSESLPPGANHLLIWRMLEAHAGKAEYLDLGRTDVTNEGLNRFKAEMGAKSSPLLYSYFPRRPATVSSERLNSHGTTLSRIWRRMPQSVARYAGPLVYKYLA